MEKTRSVDFGLKLNALLGLRGISQSQISEEGGVNKSSLSRFFRGETDIRSKQLIRVLNSIGVDLHQILNQKIDEKLGKEKLITNIGSELETIIQNLDDLMAHTILETIISKAKRVKKTDLKKEIKNLEEYRKNLLLKTRK